MNLEPTDSQVAIAAAAAEFLRGELPPARLMQKDREPAVTARRELGAIAAQGWIGATLPADVEGSQMSLTDEIVIAREAGRLLAPFGLLPSALGARLAYRANDRTLALSLVQGSQFAGLAAPRAAVPRVAVYGASVGDAVIALTPARAVLLKIPQASAADSSVDPGVSMVWLEADYGARLHELSGAPALTLWAESITLGSAMLCGIAEAARDLAIEHAKTRKQFGKPIGAFQAISHTCANIAVQCEAAWAQVRYAAASAQEDHERWTDEAAAAQIVASRAAFATIKAAIQIHGALGATSELILHRYLKRALVLDAALGRSHAALDQLVLD